VAVWWKDHANAQIPGRSHPPDRRPDSYSRYRGHQHSSSSAWKKPSAPAAEVRPPNSRKPTSSVFCHQLYHRSRPRHSPRRQAESNVQRACRDYSVPPRLRWAKGEAEGEAGGGGRIESNHLTGCLSSLSSSGQSILPPRITISQHHHLLLIGQLCQIHRIANDRAMISDPNERGWRFFPSPAGRGTCRRRRPRR